MKKSSLVFALIFSTESLFALMPDSVASNVKLIKKYVFEGILRPRYRRTDREQRFSKTGITGC